MNHELGRWYTRVFFVLPILTPGVLRSLYSSGLSGPNAVTLANALEHIVIPYGVFATIGCVLIWRRPTSEYVWLAAISPVIFAPFQLLYLAAIGSLPRVTHVPDVLVAIISVVLFVLPIAYSYVTLYLIGYWLLFGWPRDAV